MSTHAHPHDEVEVGVYGLMAEFLTPEELLSAARKTAEAGYKKVDAYSPFPVHGVAEAIGAKTILPWLIFGGGLFGAINGFGMQYFAMNIHYKINIAGKPADLGTWPSFMPVTFELTVLFAAATAVFGMLALNGLPRPYNPVFNVPEFAGRRRTGSSSASRRTTPSSTWTKPRGSWKAWSRSPSPKSRSERFRMRIGNHPRPTPPARHPRRAGWLLAASGLIFWAGCRKDMYDQPRYEPYEPSTFFGDGTSSRPPSPGPSPAASSGPTSSITTGKAADGKDTDVFPMAVDRDLIELGRERYLIYCSPCHGRLGDGRGMVVRRGFSPPPTFHAEYLKKIPVGHFYNVITNGYGAMYSYAARIPVRHRWAIAAYIRTLQYSQDASPEDLTPDERKSLAEADRPGPPNPVEQQEPGRGQEMNPNGTLLPLVHRIRGRALIVGLAGAALMLAGRLRRPTLRRNFDRAYLFSFVFWFGISLGSLALLMLHRQLGGAWGFLIRRPLEAGAMTLPLMLALFVPILVDLERIYPWVSHHRAEAANPEGGRPATEARLKASDQPVGKGSPVKVINRGASAGASGTRRDPLEVESAEVFALQARGGSTRSTSRSGWRSTSRSGSSWR